MHKSDPAPQLAKGQKQDKNDKITGNKNIVVNTFKVKESYARAEMEKASADYKLQQKSNFPHEFRNNKGGASGSKVSQSKWVPEIKWGVPKCDDYKSQLVEYPIYVSVQRCRLLPPAKHQPSIGSHFLIFKLVARAEQH